MIDLRYRSTKSICIYLLWCFLNLKKRKEPSFWPSRSLRRKRHLLSSWHLSLVSRTHMVEGERHLPKVVLWPPHKHHGTSAHTQWINKCNFEKMIGAFKLHWNCMQILWFYWEVSVVGPVHVAATSNVWLFELGFFNQSSFVTESPVWFLFFFVYF